MTASSLSNSTYTLHLTSAEYKKHQHLLYIGSLMSQCLTHGYFCEDTGVRLSYEQALQDIVQFIQAGKRYSRAWDQLAMDLQPIYNRAAQETPAPSER